MRLRVLIFLTLSIVVIGPVFILTSWVISDSLVRENEILKDKHLLIARNLAKTLDQYAIGLKNSFKLVANLHTQDKQNFQLGEFLSGQNFNHFCIAGLKTGVVTSSIGPSNLPCPPKVPEMLFGKFLDLLDPDRIVISPVIKNPAGVPTLYLLQAFGDSLIIGAVSTKFIVSHGSAVAFGLKGHAAIVDQTGGVMAHPLPAWQDAVKNIKKIEPVRRMLAGETGTMTFYSPALKAEMVTGYTHVPSTGWGVMVPQPQSEIRATTEQVRNNAIGIGLGGIVFSGLLSWFLSGYLTRSLSSVIATSKRMAEGDLDARVELSPALRPKEIGELSEAFNTMANAIKARDSELEMNSKYLESALLSAEDANRAKSEFLASMSHELRTPLTSSLGSLGLLQAMSKDNLSKDEMELLDIAKRNNDTLLRLVSELLDYEKVLSGRMELETERQNICTLTTGTIKNCQGYARTHSVNFAFIDPAEPLYADVQADRLEQVINNLLSNAAKFSGSSTDVDVSVERDDDFVVVRVRDYGIGIPDEFRSKIFERFTQIDSSSTRNHGGAGLGLSISKALIEAMGGTLDFETELGVGSTFFVRLPVSFA